MLEIHDGFYVDSSKMGIQKHYEDNRLVSQQKRSSRFPLQPKPSALPQKFLSLFFLGDYKSSE